MTTTANQPTALPCTAHVDVSGTSRNCRLLLRSLRGWASTIHNSPYLRERLSLTFVALPELDGVSRVSVMTAAQSADEAKRQLDNILSDCRATLFARDRS